MSILQSQLVEKGFEKSENSEQIVLLLLLFLFIPCLSRHSEKPAMDLLFSLHSSVMRHCHRFRFPLTL